MLGWLENQICSDWDDFERLYLDPGGLIAFQGSLVGFSREHVQVKGYITLKIMFKLEENANMIKVRYHLVDANFSYNIIMGWHSFNLMEASISIMYMCMKYLLPNKRLGIFQSDQETARRFYHYSLRLKRVIKIMLRREHMSYMMSGHQNVEDNIQT